MIETMLCMDDGILEMMIIGFTFGGMILMMAIMMPFVMVMSNHRKQEKKAKIEAKLRARETEMQIAADLKKAEWENDKSKPIFCRYCGARNDRNGKHCNSCGCSL